MDMDTRRAYRLALDEAFNEFPWLATSDIAGILDVQVTSNTKRAVDTALRKLGYPVQHAGKDKWVRAES